MRMAVAARKTKPQGVGGWVLLGMVVVEVGEEEEEEEEGGGEA